MAPVTPTPAPQPIDEIQNQLSTLTQTLYLLTVALHSHQPQYHTPSTPSTPSTTTTTSGAPNGLAAPLPSTNGTNPSTLPTPPLIHHTHILLSNLTRLAATTATTRIPIPPETIGYVDSGRNPDIYTREIIEAVEKRGGELKGRGEAMRGWLDVLMREVTAGRPELEGGVREVVTNTVGAE